ncbi:MAG: ABC transporter permease [Planctomycetes bacterium]|nr:ABC transporter permease [Planctomycetota bacterium]
MRLGDLLRWLFDTLRAQRLRSLLTMLGIVIGIGAMVLLSSIGAGARAAVVAEFTQFGTTILGVQPGRATSFGIGAGSFGGTVRPLTLADARALERIPGVRFVAPHVVGLAAVERAALSRNVYVYGTTVDDQEVLQWWPRLGGFLPAGDPERAAAVCVLGDTVARELFGRENPLGARVRIGTARYVVVGVMAEKGQVLGFDLDDLVIVPVARALELFDRDGLTEIHVLVAGHSRMREVELAIECVLAERHDGELDVTLSSQADMLALVDEVLDVLTRGVLAIAAISLLVGALGILTIQWVSVHERTAEIGLVKALGASDRQVELLFLAEAGALSLSGGVVGVLVALGLGELVHLVRPEFPLVTPSWSAPLALATALAVGVLAGVLPARKAARLDPVEALHAE